MISSTNLPYLVTESESTMKIYEYTPKKNTKKLAGVTGLLLGGAVILILIYKLIPRISSPWMFQLLAVGMLMMAVFITSRYIMKSYVYAITEQDGDRLLTVTEIQGRHTITVCRISLTNIQEVTVADNGQDAPVKNRIRSEKRKSYNYCIDFFEDKYACVFACEGGEDIAVKLSFDEKLCELLGK